MCHEADKDRHDKMVSLVVRRGRGRGRGQSPYFNSKISRLLDAEISKGKT